MSDSPTVRLLGLTRRFGPAAALDNLSVEIAAGRLVALLGPSGSGKTTLLRILAGLDFADAGDVTFDGESVRDVPARLRRIGFVFQNYALFRHMTVFDNVAFGLRALPRDRRPSNHEVATRVQGLLERMQIGTLAARWPSQLSGGQRQRVALARALAIRPRLLLLDEPFGALDARVRKDLRRWLRQVHQDSGLTTILVTHDQDEALDVADEIIVLNQGRIEQQASPTTVRDAPATPFVFQFMGDAVAVPLTIRASKLWHGDKVLDLVVPADLPREPREATGYVRPADLRLATAVEGTISAMVQHVGSTRLTLRLTDGGEPFDLPREGEPDPGEAARVTLIPRRLRVYRTGAAPFDADAPPPEARPWHPAVVRGGPE